MSSTGSTSQLLSLLLLAIDNIDYAINYFASLMWATFTWSFSPFPPTKKYFPPKPTNFVLITGCSSGIGASAAKYLAKLGYGVFAGVRKREDAQHLLDLFPNSIVPVVMDVTNEDQVRETLSLVEQECFKRGACLFAIVNNAGMTQSVPMEVVKPDGDLMDVLRVNLIGVHRVTKAFLPILRANEGRIVIIGSVTGTMVMPGFGAYSLSKAAVKGYADALRREVSPFGVAVSLLEPGLVHTPIVDKTIESAHSSLFPELEEKDSKARRIYSKHVTSTIAFFSVLKCVGSQTNATDRAIYHALTSTFPMAYYHVGLDARAIYWLKGHLSEFLFDNLIGFFYY